jgi:sulfur carrier protein ThiS
VDLNIKLYGTLSRSFDDYDHLSGLDISLAEESTVGDLLAHLKIQQGRVGMILMDGKPAQAGTVVEKDSQIKIFQPIAGG